MKLYQINKSLYAKNVEKDWQQSLSVGDAVLFLEVGVLRMLSDHQTLKQLSEKNVAIYFREQDLKANGLTPTFGEAISDHQWVELTTLYNKIVSW